MGDQDRNYNFDQVSLLTNNIPNCKIEIFKNCCHNVHLEEPEKFNKIVQNFLNNT